MNIYNIYLNIFYLLFLSLKIQTTFKFIVSAVNFGNNPLNYLLIKLIINLIIFNLSKFDNLLDLNVFFYLIIYDYSILPSNKIIILSSDNEISLK